MTSEDTIQRLIHNVMTAHPDEIDCDRCFELLDRFVEQEILGQDHRFQDELLAVKDHLRRCRDCREEFEVLLESALKLE